MNLMIPDELAQATKLTEQELLLELAIMLYQQERLNRTQAAYLARIDVLDFLRVLQERNISSYYETKDLEHDIKTLKELGRL